MNVKQTVLDRYSEGAKEVQPALCCPVDYDAGLLAMLPKEIIEKDYGCGDPSRYVRSGDIVLDLGSGSGKICYMAAQLVGPQGFVIGADMNDDMLALSGKYQAQMADKLGGQRVRFVKANIQDLALDLRALDEYLAANPVRTHDDLNRLQSWEDTQRRERPLIADHSVDLVISNCVLNLVAETDKRQLVREIHRVLKPGGRIAISDIVSGRVVPEQLKKNSGLWSGCISGAFQEQEFLQAFAAVGFQALTYDKWDAKPWRVVEGIEFRSVTLTAVKSLDTPRVEAGHAVMYRGPFQAVTDDQGAVYVRGERRAVCAQTFGFLTNGPMRDSFIGIAPDGVPCGTAGCC